MRNARTHRDNRLAGTSWCWLLAARADRLSCEGPRSASCGPQPLTSTMQQPLWTRQTWRVHELPSSWRRSTRPVGPYARARARAPRRRPRMITIGATATRAHCPTVRPDRGGQNRGRALSPWSDDSCRCPAVCAADRLTSGRLVALFRVTMVARWGTVRGRFGQAEEKSGHEAAERGGGLRFQACPWEVPAG